MYFLSTTVIGFYQRSFKWMFSAARKRPVVFTLASIMALLVTCVLIPEVLDPIVPSFVTMLLTSALVAPYIFGAVFVYFRDNIL